MNSSNHDPEINPEPKSGAHPGAEHASAKPISDERRRALLRRLKELAEYQEKIERSLQKHPRVKLYGQILLLIMILVGLYATNDEEAVPYFYAIGIGVLLCGGILWWLRQRRAQYQELQDVTIRQIRREYPEEVERGGGELVLSDPIAVDALIRILKTDQKEEEKSHDE